MQREMRRKDRLITAEEAYEILDKCEYGVLGTVCPDGTPYAVPLSYAREDNVIYMHCATEGRKLENIAFRDQVCFTVVSAEDVELKPESFGTLFASVMVFGRVEVVESDEDKIHGLEVLVKKWHNEYYEKGMKYIMAAKDKTVVLKLTIEDISGKARRK
ncbi:MAG: pyridoxamine 5'-phosphate oxidase family protein [Mogibacterium sp.]|nr:pyridoxamine 5'-phosphate oxidase family protein [Mogibacterium sp.]